MPAGAGVAVAWQRSTRQLPNWVFPAARCTVLLHRFRAGSGRATDLMPASPEGGRGRGRLGDRGEAIVAETIRKRFLSRQKRSVAVIHREIRQACVAQGLLAPSRNTVAARIDRLHPAQVARGRGGPDAARPLAVRR